MAKKQKPPNKEAWATAKTLCRLSQRQIEMARALGMNPKKLPGLRPTAQQRWKLPVGAFIEECYRKRFGQTRESGASRQSAGVDTSPPEGMWDVSEPATQVSNLVCYLLNLSEDLQKWLAQGPIPPEVLAEVRQELTSIADALAGGGAIPQVPGIPVPPDQPVRSSGPSGCSRIWDEYDDDVPF